MAEEAAVSLPVDAPVIEGWQPEDPWDLEQLEMTNRLDALVDREVRAEAQRVEEPTPGRFDPYHPSHQPLVQRQLNPARRLHPDWPEEWYVHVPTSAVTWIRKAVPPGERMQVHAFPSEPEAIADAQAVWARHWSERAAREPAGRKRIAPPQSNRPVPVESRGAFTVTPDELEALTPEQLVAVSGPNTFLHIKGPKPDPMALASPTVYAVAVESRGWALVLPGEPHRLLAAEGVDLGDVRMADGSSRELRRVARTRSAGESPLVLEGEADDLARQLPLGFQWARPEEPVRPGHVRVSLGTPEALAAVGLDPADVNAFYDGTDPLTGDARVVLGETPSQLAVRARRAFMPYVPTENPDDSVSRARAVWLDDRPRSPAGVPDVSPVIAVSVGDGVWTLVQTGLPPRLLTEDADTPGAMGVPVQLSAHSLSALAEALPSGLALAGTPDNGVAGAVRVYPNSSELQEQFRLPVAAIQAAVTDPAQATGADFPVALGEPLSAVARHGLARMALASTDTGAPRLNQWLEEGRQILREARKMDCGIALDDAVLAAVVAVRPLDGSKPFSPEALRVAAATAVERAATVDPRLVWATRQWAQHAERLTAQSAQLFVTGMQSDEAARVAAGDDTPAAIGVASVGTLSQLERAELFATPLPSGQMLLWGAEVSMSASERAQTPDLYQASLARPVMPKWVQTRLAPNLEAARTRAAESGKTLTVTGGLAKKRAAPGSPTARALAMWREQVRAQHSRNPALGERIIRQALTRPAVHVDPEAEARLIAFVEEHAGQRLTQSEPAASIPVKPVADSPVYVGPWRAGEGVLWMKNARGQAQLAVQGDDGRWRPAEPGADVQPVVVQAEGGFAAVTAAAQKHVPHAAPLEVPTPLARTLADRIGPPALNLPRDVIWRAVSLADRPAAVSWTYVYRMAPRPNGRPSLTLAGAPLARSQEEKPVVFAGRAPDEALQRATGTLSRQGLTVVPMKRPFMPREVADAIFAADLRMADRPGPRPVDPFDTLFRLPEEQRGAVVDALPEPLRPFAVRGAFQVQPREFADQVGGVDHAVQGLRKAERALGDLFMNHPELSKPAASVDPEPSTPAVGVSRPGLGMTPA